VLQFAVTMVITFMTLAFLATGVVLSLHDRTPGLENAYLEKIYPAHNALDQNYLVPRKQEIAKVAAYSDYRDLILRVASTDTSTGLTQDLDAIVAFYESYIACRMHWQCRPSKQIDTAIVDLWFSYRPILEERRVDLWGPAFAAELQRHAEAIRKPMYDSKVRRDPATGKSTLLSIEPVRKMQG
jgi:hypothetical protein